MYIIAVHRGFCVSWGCSSDEGYTSYHINPPLSMVLQFGKLLCPKTQLTVSQHKHSMVENNILLLNF